MPSMERVSYQGWPNSYRISNGLVELVILTDVGPRIIRFGFVGKENEFAEFTDTLGKTGGDDWRTYGGHRLWHSPENDPRSYFPDNHPVELEEHPDFVRVIQPIEKTTGIQKEMDIRLWPNESHVQVTHRLRNHNLWAVELAPWALSVMASGGIAIIPLPPRGSFPKDLLPTNTLTLWAYTDMSDPRWVWGRKYVLLRQDPSISEPQMGGMMSIDGWVAYARNGHLFVKTFPYKAGAAYPDFGCSVEVFTNADMLELETLGTLTRLEPGKIVEHEEQWFLFDGVPQPSNEMDIDHAVLPNINTCIRSGATQTLKGKQIQGM